MFPLFYVSKAYIYCSQFIHRTMPSRKAALVFCNCTECCHISHHPKGRPFSSAIEKTAHLARMHLEREPRSHQTEPQVAQEDIGDIGARVFATTVLDDGPD